MDEPTVKLNILTDEELKQVIRDAIHDFVERVQDRFHESGKITVVVAIDQELEVLDRKAE